MVSAYYSYILLQHSNVNVDGNPSNTIYQHELSYREYEFVEGCSYPACPRDYGEFNGKSRFPLDIPGSIEFT